MYSVTDLLMAAIKVAETGYLERKSEEKREEVRFKNFHNGLAVRAILKVKSDRSVVERVDIWFRSDDEPIYLPGPDFTIEQLENGVRISSNQKEQVDLDALMKRLSR